VKCLATSSPATATRMSGVLDTLDTILNPQKAADQWIAGQRAAVSGDLAAQRAMFVADLRVVASEATTEAAYKFAIAGVAAFGFSLLVWKLATRSR
jgi:hypothetical protein